MTTQKVYATDPEVRFDFSDTGGATRDLYNTGYEVETNVGGPVVWVQAAAALVEGQDVIIATDATTGVVSAALATTALVSTTPKKIGIVHKGLASGTYGWVFIGPFSNVDVLTTTGIAAGAQLTTHTVPGTVSTGGTAINGLYPLAVSTAGLTKCNAVGIIGTSI